MSDLDERFEQAQRDARTVTTRPGNDDLRRLYGLFKQATSGDVAASGAKRPGRLDPIGRAKYDAWHACGGRTSTAAKEDYRALVRRLSAA